MKTKFLPTAVLALIIGFVCQFFFAPRVHAEDSVEIVFNETPIERGMTFDRTAVRPARINFGGQEFQSWMSDTWSRVA